MCTILTSHGKEIKKEYLENIQNSNGDGLGFSYCKDGKLILEKGFFDFDKFYEAYQKTIGNPILIHARFATSGLKDKDNCHPFEITPNLHFAHNGTISFFTQRIANCSDTYAFGEQLLKPIAENFKRKNKTWWRSPLFKWWIESAIKSNNKLAILDNFGQITIFNESSGEWIDKDSGIWASNDFYKKVKTRYTTNYSQQKNNTSNTNTNSNVTCLSPREELELEREFENATKQSNIIDVTDITVPDDIPDGENEEAFDITKTPPEELAEIDKFLAILNNEVSY